MLNGSRPVFSPLFSRVCRVAAARLRDGALDCGGLAGPESNGFSWVADMAKSVCAFGGPEAAPFDDAARPPR